MNDEELFDNGIDGTEFASIADFYEEEAESESTIVCKENGLEVMAWPTYGNYTIITDTFHMYWYPGSNKIDVFDLRTQDTNYPNLHKHVLSIDNSDLFFFGTKKSAEPEPWEVNFYTGEQVNKKVQRYLDLKAFL